MKRKLTVVLAYLYYGIANGCVAFILICLGFYLSGEREELMLIMDHFAEQTLGAALVGIACGTTAIVYRSERLSFKAQVLIHFTVGVGTFYPTAVHLGWIPFYSETVWHNVISVMIACCIFFATWFVFYLFNKNEARQINWRLSEMKREDQEQTP